MQANAPEEPVPLPSFKSLPMMASPDKEKLPTGQSYLITPWHS